QQIRRRNGGDFNLRADDNSIRTKRAGQIAKPVHGTNNGETQITWKRVGLIDDNSRELERQAALSSQLVGKTPYGCAGTNQQHPLAFAHPAKPPVGNPALQIQQKKNQSQKRFKKMMLKAI